MSESEDKSQKTEEPTSHKIEEAKKKGQIPSSKEVYTFFLFAALTFMVVLIMPVAFVEIVKTLKFFFEYPHTVSFDSMNGQETLWKVGKNLSLYFLLLILPFVVGVIISGGLQTGFRIGNESLKLKWDKLSPAKGLKRLFSFKGVEELGKGILKLVVVAVAIYWVLLPSLSTAIGMLNFDASQTMMVMGKLAFKILWITLIILMFIASLDYAYQRFEWKKNLKMSKQEIKDEYKQMEGDPHVKGKLKEQRQKFAKQSVAARLQRASVLITNPTHYAIALEYVYGEMEAPKVIAKGADFAALRMREMAKEYNLPIVENPPLARSLYADVELDQFIPETLYKIVAEIIKKVMKIG